jgi:hypothetical protein
MSNDDPKITARLNEVMNSIPCPVAGCWPMHGAHSQNWGKRFRLNISISVNDVPSSRSAGKTKAAIGTSGSHRPR